MRKNRKILTMLTCITLLFVSVIRVYAQSININSENMPKVDIIFCKDNTEMGASIKS